MYENVRSRLCVCVRERLRTHACVFALACVCSRVCVRASTCVRSCQAAASLFLLSPARQTARVTLAANNITTARRNQTQEHIYLYILFNSPFAGGVSALQGLLLLLLHNYSLER